MTGRRGDRARPRPIDEVSTKCPRVKIEVTLCGKPETLDYDRICDRLSDHKAIKVGWLGNKNPTPYRSVHLRRLVDSLHMVSFGITNLRIYALFTAKNELTRPSGEYGRPKYLPIASVSADSRAQTRVRAAGAGFSSPFNSKQGLLS